MSWRRDDGRRVVRPTRAFIGEPTFLAIRVENAKPRRAADRAHLRPPAGRADQVPDRDRPGVPRAPSPNADGGGGETVLRFAVHRGIVASSGWTASTWSLSDPFDLGAGAPGESPWNDRLLVMPHPRGGVPLSGCADGCRSARLCPPPPVRGQRALRRRRDYDPATRCTTSTGGFRPRGRAPDEDVSAHAGSAEVLSRSTSPTASRSGNGPMRASRRRRSGRPATWRDRRSTPGGGRASWRTRTCVAGAGPSGSPPPRPPGRSPSCSRRSRACRTSPRTTSRPSSARSGDG